MQTGQQVLAELDMAEAPGREQGLCSTQPFSALIFAKVFELIRNYKRVIAIVQIL